MRKVDGDLTKHTLLLFAGDFEKLGDAHPELGAGPVIRQLVRSYLKQLGGSTTPNISVNIEI